MTTIKISRDLEEIKAGGIRMFNRRQLIYGFITLVVVVLVGVFFSKILGLNSNVGGFAGLLCGTPIGYIGFFRKNGMNLKEYNLAKQSLNNSKPLFYESTENEDYIKSHMQQSTSNNEKNISLTQKMINAKKKKDVKKIGKNR